MSAVKYLVAIACLLFSSLAQAKHDLDIQHLSTYAAGAFADGAAEIVAHDPKTQRLFVINGATDSVDILDMRKPSALALIETWNLSNFGNPNSVAVSGETVAIAIGAPVKTDPGHVVFYTTRGVFLGAVLVGALPDMVIFTPDGRTVLVANEGEPDDSYTVDPEGSVSIISIPRWAGNITQADVRTATFTKYNNVPIDPRIRVFGPNASVAQDLEPEYIAVSDDSKKAWVVLQEANAIAELDIRKGQFTSLRSLGFK
ncbi:MAG: hypothetical protein AB7O65_06215, partial [Candidatus Korobacteraceae bacterium]